MKIEPGRASRSRSRDRDHKRDRHRESASRPLRAEQVSAHPSAEPSTRETWIDTACGLMRRVHPTFLSKQIVEWEIKHDKPGASMTPPRAFHNLAATLVRITDAVGPPPDASPAAALGGHMSAGVRAWGASWVTAQLWHVIVSNVRRDEDDDDECAWVAYLDGPLHGVLFGVKVMILSSSPLWGGAAS